MKRNPIRGAPHGDNGGDQTTDHATNHTTEGATGTASKGAAGAAPTALIAEDEPLVAAALERELAAAWPDLRVVAVAGSGREALEQIAAWEPHVAFLDIAMPGMSGIDVARECAKRHTAPQIVFVTAYDRYALDAFDAAAVDYLLKPVEPARLARTVERLRARLTNASHAQVSRGDMQADLQRLLGKLEQIAGHAGLAVRTRDGAAALPAPLRYLRASSGNEVRMVPVDEVLFLEAADKYVVVTTRHGELLIRTSLKELCAQLDAQRFWQVHRGTVVNVDHVESASVNALGRMSLKLRGHGAAVAVSRQYAHLFRQM